MHALSIIVPVYNAINYLTATIESILGQTYSDFELLIVDDGSNDGSAELCEKLAELDRRIQVFHVENGGVSKARNFGLNVAKGEYIAFVDSDDLLESGMYEALIYDLECNQCDVAMCGVVCQREYKESDFVGDSAVEVYANPLELLPNKDLFIGSVVNKVYRRSTIGKIRFHQDITYSEDVLFVFETLLASKKLAVEKNAYYHYMQRANSLSWKDENSEIWWGNKKVKEIIYNSLLAIPASKQLVEYAFGEYAKAILALYRYAVKYNQKQLYEELEKSYKNTVRKYLIGYRLGLGKQLEYRTYTTNYTLARCIHYYPKKFR